MKKLLRISLLLSLSLWLLSCEEGVFGPRQPECLESRQTNDNGLSIEREYSDRGVTAIRYSNNGVPSSSYMFTYGPGGRITESQYVNETNGTLGTLEMISYNEKGKWKQSMIDHSNGRLNTYTPAYDDQNQIKSLTATATNPAGAVSTIYTIEYQWEGGNNTRLTYTSPNLHQVIQYEFDLTKENKRRKEQEKTAFFSTAVAYNKNMLKRMVSTVTNATATTESVSMYSWQYNGEGYPTRVTRTNTSGTGTPTTITTDFEYNCN